ncbi:MAG: 2Fe-2S iron-sulfur cluster-binding protein, partial [Halofilum sp. (in: g-proteobacteria)]|nr:2Fe-2S iron-sulfur cluster-binding protein [Halofilum sp. (in: g-proteobacteria)]
MSGFRTLQSADGDSRIGIVVDGIPVEVPAGRSLLAALLAAPGVDIGFFCAIGQCQQCIVRINGYARAACMVRPEAGDRVE